MKCHSEQSYITRGLGLPCHVFRRPSLAVMSMIHSWSVFLKGCASVFKKNTTLFPRGDKLKGERVPLKPIISHFFTDSKLLLFLKIYISDFRGEESNFDESVTYLRGGNLYFSTEVPPESPFHRINLVDFTFCSIFTSHLVLNVESCLCYSRERK